MICQTLIFILWKNNISYLPFNSGFQCQELGLHNPNLDVKTDNKVRKVRKRKPPGSACSRAELKRRRNAGEEYVTRTGKIVQKKEYVPIDCRCRLECTVKVSHDVRKLIFDQFHALADWNNQTQFIVSSVTVLDVKERKKKVCQELCGSISRRCASRIFYLTSQKIRVCKPVFLSTLGITNKRLDYALRHKAVPLTALATPDLRGKKGPTNKTPLDVEERIKAHINSYQKLSSHFPQPGKASQNHTSDVTISKMYSQYQEQCLAHGFAPASMWVYAKIYHSEFKGHMNVSKREMPCKKCERTKAILWSGDKPEKVIQMLLKEYQETTVEDSSIHNG